MRSLVVLVRVALLYFAIVFGAGFVLGAIRVTVLVPRFGARVSELSEMPVMFTVIYLSARLVVRKYAMTASPGTALRAGALALLFLLASEFALAVVLADRSLAQYVASKDPVSGSVYVALLVVYAVMPWFLIRKNEA